MAQADQAMRTGKSLWNKAKDRERAHHLAEIVMCHGWPDANMVGIEGATAAWLIAQHADFDVKLQAHFLKLLRASVSKKRHLLHIWHTLQTEYVLTMADLNSMVHSFALISVEN